MFILFLALIFGLVALILLLRSMGSFFDQLHSTGAVKARAIIKLILLIEIVIYILVFAVVIVKTIFL